MGKTWDYENGGWVSAGGAATAAGIKKVSDMITTEAPPRWSRRNSDASGGEVAPGKGKGPVIGGLGQGEWEYQTQLTARIVTDVYIHWLKKVLKLGRPLMRLGDERMVEWLYETSEGTIYHEEPLVRPMEHDRDDVEAKKRDVAAGKKKVAPPPPILLQPEVEEKFCNPITSINPTGGPICGVLSKRNNPCGQPKATCRYHGPLEFRYKTGDGPLKPGPGMQQPPKRGRPPSNPDFLGGFIDDGEFLNDEEDMGEWGQEEDELDLFQAFGEQLYQESYAEVSPTVPEEEEEEEQMVDSDDERAATNKFLENLERFQMNFGHKSMPNVIYMHDNYELLL